MEASDRALFLEILEDVEIQWMNGRELGQTAHEPHDVLLWPYEHESAEELMKTFVHEVVHLMYADLPEGAVNAKTEALVRLEWCRREAYHFLTAALLEGLKAMKIRTKGKILIK